MNSTFFARPITRRAAFRIAPALAAAGIALCPTAARAVRTRDELVKILQVVDERQSNSGDWRSAAYIEQKERDKVDVIYETQFFRRSADQKFMMLFTKPKASAGQGYLRIDKNLWFYDPAVGKW
jgi:hypothetical protein